MDTPRLALSPRAMPVFGGVLLLAALPGAWVAPQVFFAAWLAGCWFNLGIVLGALSWLWIHRLSAGTWGRVLRPHILRLAARLPRVLVLFVPLAFGLRLLYPWLGTDPGASASDPAGRAFLEVWQSPAFLAARVALYAIVWLALARRSRRPLSSGEAALSLVLHLTLTSLASVDVLVALVPGWSSSIFGLVAVAGQAFGGGALAIALACRAIRRAGTQPVTDGVPLTRDFGNLLMTAALLWAYLAFMQLLIIWAENLPREISWYVPRLQSGWIGIGAALVVVHFALPLFLLLFRAIKDSPRRLERLALAMLAANALDAVWLVLPSVAPHELAAWWLAPLLVTGLALIAFGGAPWRPAALATDAAPAELSDVRA